MRLGTLIERIRSDESVGVLPRPATDGMLRDLQDRVRVELPKDYLSFMKAFNGGEHRFARLYSLGIAPWDFLAQWDTFRERIRAVGDGKLLPFGDDYSGSPFCFDLRTGGKKYPVVIWNSWAGPDDEPEFLAKSFLDFAAAAYDESPQPERRESLMGGVTALKPGTRVIVPGMEDLGLCLEVLDPFSTRQQSMSESDVFNAIFDDPKKLFAFMLLNPERGQADFDAQDALGARISTDDGAIELRESDGRRTGTVVQSGGLQLPGQQTYTRIHLLMNEERLKGTEILNLVFNIRKK